MRTKNAIVSKPLSASSSRSPPSPPTPIRLPDIRRCAELAASTIRDFGGEAEILETEGNPIVHGRFDSGSDLPTVTVYNHLDVQPASRETEPWDTDPFVFTKQGDRYFGRGTTDDKGPALTALFGIRAAREAGVQSEHAPAVGARRGDRLAELRGGDRRSTRKQLADRLRARLRHDLGLARAAGLSGRAARPAGLRARRSRPATTDQHSGVTGGAARNPIGELMKLVSEMYDATTGKVKIKGFYDDVEPPSKKELDDFRDVRLHGRRSSRRTTSSSRSAPRTPIDVMKRIWAMPTFEVHGVVGGYTGPGIKTIIPPRADGEDLLPPRAESGPEEDHEARPRLREGAQSRREGRRPRRRCCRTRRRRPARWPTPCAAR